MPGFRSLLISLATLVPLGGVAGCTTWKTQEASPAEVVGNNPRDRVRVTRSDGSMVELVRPLVTADTLTGHWVGANDSTSRVAIPLSDVRSLALNRVSAGKTALLIGGLGVTALLVAAAAETEETRPSPTPSDPQPPISCPLVYSWDGGNWRLDSGTFGGAIAPALARTDLDNLLHARPESGVLRLRVANELNETDYLDALSVMVVDHPAGYTVAPDGDGRIHILGAPIGPAAARDFRGEDALGRVSRSDGWAWESNPFGRDTAVAEDIRDGLELVFPKPLKPTARLVVDGNNTPWAAHLMQELIAAHGRETRAWYDSLGSSPILADRFAALMTEEAFLGVSVWVGGKWQRQGYIWEAGPEILKRQVFPLDLSRVEGDSVRIRLESAPSFWLIDQVTLDSSAAAPVTVHEVQAQHAIDRAGSDVSDRLRSVDGRYFVMETGDGAELQFPMPELRPGHTRSYLVQSSGWYRIHGPETAAPDRQLLTRVLTRPHGASRVAVARLNDALLSLSRGPR
ncbi:MAG TPA: hypothetical protein VFZ87_00820 [Gemmatimonadales bacterium]